MEQPKVADRIYADLSKFYKVKNTPEEFKQKLYSDEKVRAKVFSDLQRHYNVKNDFNSFNESILKEATPEPSFFNKLREQSGFNKFMAEQNEALNTAQQQMGQAQVNVGGIQGVENKISTGAEKLFFGRELSQDERAILKHNMNIDPFKDIPAIQNIKKKILETPLLPLTKWTPPRNYEGDKVILSKGGQIGRASCRERV